MTNKHHFLKVGIKVIYHDSNIPNYDAKYGTITKVNSIYKYMIEDKDSGDISEYDIDEILAHEDIVF